MVFLRFVLCLEYIVQTYLYHPFLVVMGERFNGFWINVSVLIAKCVRLLVFPSYNIFYG